MVWHSWADFWSMGGRGLYVWGSFFVVFFCIAVEIILTRQQQVKRRRDLLDYFRATADDSSTIAQAQDK